MLLNIEISGKSDKERFKKWLVNTDPGYRHTVDRNLIKVGSRDVYTWSDIIQYRTLYQIRNFLTCLN